MEMISSSQLRFGGREEAWSKRLQAGLARWGWIGLLLGAAVLLGMGVAWEKWLLLIAAGALPLVVLWPVYVTLGAFAFLVPFDVVSVLQGKSEGTTLTFFAGAAAGMVLLATALLRRRLLRPLRPAMWWLVFLAFGLFSTLWALDPERTITRIPTAVALILLVVTAASVKIDLKELNWVVLATIGGAVAAALYSIRQFSQGQFYHGFSGRSSISLGEHAVDPNMFAASMFLPLALVVGYFLHARGKLQRAAAALAGGLLVASIFVTVSRGALLGLAVLVFVFILRLGLNRRVLIMAVLMGAGAATFSGPLMARIETASLSGGSGRLYIWPVGLAAMKHVGLYGAGLDNFRDAYVKYLGEGGTNHIYSYQEADAHNIYLATAVELGMPGLAIMIMAFVSALRLTRTTRVSQAIVPACWPVAYEAAASAMLVSSFFVGMLWQKSFWLLWIVLLLAMRVARETGPENSPFGVVAKSVAEPAFATSLHSY